MSSHDSLVTDVVHSKQQFDLQLLNYTFNSESLIGSGSGLQTLHVSAATIIYTKRLFTPKLGNANQLEYLS